MPLNSWDIPHVPTVDHGTIEPTTLMAAGSALGVVSQAEEAYQDSLQNETNSMLMQSQMNIPYDYFYQMTAGTVFQTHVDDIWNSTPSPFPTQSNTDYNTHPTMTNSSTNTKTKKEKPAAYKLVTLTLTGQLKPSILTKVPRRKSSPSTKVPLGSIAGGW